jgi:DNA-binding response OmpR family regulator
VCAGPISHEVTVSSLKPTANGIVALFNASDDTIDMIQTILTKSDSAQSLVWCHFADLKKGVVDFKKYLLKHNPEVVIFDISPPYDENWQYFKTMRDSESMKGRGCVLTTTNKNRLDEVLGSDSHALEVVGKPEDLKQIRAEIEKQTRVAHEANKTVA